MLLTTILFIAILIVVIVCVATTGVDQSPCNPGVANHLHTVTSHAAVVGNPFLNYLRSVGHSQAFIRIPSFYSTVVTCDSSTLSSRHYMK